MLTQNAVLVRVEIAMIRERMSEFKEHTEINLGSDRSFGLVVAGVMVAISLFPFLSGGGLRWWSLLIALGFGSAALVRPKSLHGLNKLWFKFGLLLSKVVSPIVLGLIFFLTVVPIGVIRRIGNKDPLNQTIDPSVKSYWVTVTAERRRDASMKHQF